jgi:RecG-like helicase
VKVFGRNKATDTPATIALPIATPIGEIEPRDHVTVRGTVIRVRTIPRSGQPSLAVTVEDETGRAVAIWSGRRAIGGITLGRRLDISGVAVPGQHELEFHNPLYTLRLPS